MKKTKQNKKKVSKTKEKPKIKVWKVCINYIHGQSFYPREIFEGIYYVGEIEEIAKSISENITPYWEDTAGNDFFINSNVEEMKQKLLAEIIGKQPKFEVVTGEMKPGCDFGYNISVNFVEVIKNGRRKEV